MFVLPLDDDVVLSRIEQKSVFSFINGIVLLAHSLSLAFSLILSH